MQWIEGRVAALRSITAYLTTYPERYAVEQIPWLADTLDLRRRTVINELADAFRGRPNVCRDRFHPQQADRLPSLI